ncbi:MAG: hypothetical protein JWM80_4089 [Cyanobacteria bacterium RYN_339]|nr:hypothetical protein [Cyanobacteria bacterium RYN_339]
MTTPINNSNRTAFVGPTARTASTAGNTAANTGAASTGKLTGDTRVASTNAPSAIGANASQAIIGAEVRLGAAWQFASA